MMMRFEMSPSTLSTAVHPGSFQFVPVSTNMFALPINVSSGGPSGFAVTVTVLTADATLLAASVTV